MRENNMRAIVKEDITSGEKCAVLEIELEAMEQIYELAFTHNIISLYEYEQYMNFFTVLQKEAVPPSFGITPRKKKKSKRDNKVFVTIPKDTESFLSKSILLPPDISDKRKIQMMRLAYTHRLLPDTEYQKIMDFEFLRSCMNCGTEVAETKRYCPYCGTMI
jgi:hypothetical protein